MRATAILDSAHGLYRVYRDVTADPYERHAIAALPSRLRHALLDLERVVCEPAATPRHAPWTPDMGVMTVTAILHGLTYQERNAVILRAVGALNKEVAATLRISCHAARAATHRGYVKLGLGGEHEASSVQALRVLHGLSARGD